MTLRQLIETCGNELDLIKVWYGDVPVEDFDMHIPSFVYSFLSIKSAPDYRLDSRVNCWFIKGRNLYILL